jgi:hypothetical protein
MTAHGVATRLTAKYGPYWARELAMSCAFSHRLVLALRFHLDRATFTKHTERRDWWTIVAACVASQAEATA